MASTGMGRLPTTLLVAGLLGVAGLWTVLADTRATTEPWRRRAVLTVGTPSGLLGLALLLAPGALMPGHGFPWLGPMADQRLGGLLMMIVDLGFLVPLLISAPDARGHGDAPAFREAEPARDGTGAFRSPAGDRAPG
jgi:hypothetical protein